MTIQEKERLLDLVSEGKASQAISEFLSLNISEERRDKVQSISAQNHQLGRKIIEGTLSSSLENETRNQITVRLIHLINATDEELIDTTNTDTDEKKPFWENRTFQIIGLLGSIASIIGIWFALNPPSPQEDLQLTVFVTDMDGNAVLEHEGRLNIPLGNRALNETIGANGRTNFPDITSSNKGDSIFIGLDAEGWDIVGKNSFLFSGDPILLKVKKDNSLGNIKGVVKTRDGQDFISDAVVRINTDTLITTDTFGIFKIILPQKMQIKKETDGYLLTISKNGYKTKTQYHYPKSSDAEIRLEKIN